MNTQQNISPEALKKVEGLGSYLEKENYKTHKLFCKDPECELCKKYKDVEL